METNVCPLLGLIDDRGAYLTYPSYENRCYAGAPNQAIPLNEQTFFCLGGHRESCPRFQAWQARQDKAQPAGAGQAATGPDRKSPFAPPRPRREPEAQARGTDATEEEVEDEAPVEAEAEMEWLPPSSSRAETFYLPPGGGYGDEEADPFWAAPAYGPPPPGDPWNYQTPGLYRGGGGRPVWPLLLAAGTLVLVLMLCAGASAAWLGVQTISSRLALVPSGTAIIEQETRPIALLTGTQFPGGIIMVTATPTPGEETATTETLPPLPMETETPTWTPFPTPFPTDTPDFNATPTWTWTPRPTPTPRDTPTFFPTNTPGPTATPTWTWTPGPTNTPPREPYSVSFSASPTTINAGQEAVLSWTVRGVDQIFLDGDPVSGPAGSRRVKPLTTTTYVLRIIQYGGGVVEERQTVTVNVPSPTFTPTATPTFTPTPFYNFSFAHNRTGTEENGTNTGCRAGDGCPLFSIQITNMGNRTARYWVTKAQTLPTGWSAFFCWGSECDFSANPPSRSVDSGQRQTMTLNFLLPSNISDGQVGSVTVRGHCENCANPVYEQTFTLTINIPQPSPSATPTPTPTPTATPEPQLKITSFPGDTNSPSNPEQCRGSTGCLMFAMTIENTGNTSVTYAARLLDNGSPTGWNPQLCRGNVCSATDETEPRELPIGGSDSFTVNLILAQDVDPQPGDLSAIVIQAFDTATGTVRASKALTIRYIP